MSVLINFKICDNSKDCNGIRACPTGAFYWDEDNKTIAVDKEKCVSCGKCACCSVDAIHFARTKEEEQKIEEEIKNDPRKLNNLFVDRYGASPIQAEFTTTEDNLETVLESTRKFMIELYSEETIECLLKSIPIKELLEAFDEECSFRKIEVTTDKLLKKYDINNLPALVFLKGNSLLGKVEGYYTNEERDELISKINYFKKI